MYFLAFSRYILFVNELQVTHFVRGFFVVVNTSRLKKSGTGHFCDKKQTKQHIAMKFKIHTIQPIIQVMWKSYNHTLKIVEMRAIWKKSSKNRKHQVLWKSCTYLQLWFFDRLVLNCHKNRDKNRIIISDP